MKVISLNQQSFVITADILIEFECCKIFITVYDKW